MRGVLLCLLSAAAFGTLGIFGKLASDAGASVTSTLLVRFSLAAAVFVLLVWATGGWAALRRLPRRVVLTGLGLGAVGYSLQSGLFFLAIGRLDVALVSLLLYTYPAFVTVAALLLRRAHPTSRTWLALGVASVGLVLVLAAAGAASFDVLGAGLALAASLTYTTYILVSDGIIGEIEPFALSALVLTGGTVTFTLAGAATGTLDLALSGEAWLWLALIALVSTVVAVSAFFAGLRRVGPSEAAILSTFEPPVTVALAFVVLGEQLSPVQLLGGALVLAAVVVLQLSPRRGRPSARLSARVRRLCSFRTSRAAARGTGSPRPAAQER